MTVSPVPPNIYTVCRRLKHNDSNLQDLDLTGLNIGNSGAIAIGRSLVGNHHLKSLALSYNLISPLGAVRLFEETSLPHVESLALKYNSIGNDGARALAQILSSHCKLKRLSIRNNYVGAAGGTELCKALQLNSSLEHVDFGTNALGNEGAKAMRCLLEHNKTLKSLCLWSNEMGPEAIKEIAEGLRNNTTLETLNLGGNRIGSEGAAILADVLRTSNTTLRNLHVANCQIGQKGALALASALKANKILVLLDILHNPIGIDGAACFSLNLKHHNRTLKELRLDYQFTGAPCSDVDAPENDDVGDGGVNAQILLYLKLNQLGRGKMINPNLPWSCWPDILKKVSQEVDLMYLIMQEKPDLLVAQ